MSISISKSQGRDSSQIKGLNNRNDDYLLQVERHIANAKRKASRLKPLGGTAYLRTKAKQTPTYNPTDAMLDAMFHGVNNV